MSQQVHDMFSSIAHRYDCANDVLSLGLHRVWRERALDLAGVTAGQTIVDLCTGTGDVAFAASRRAGPSGKVIGVDFVEAMLDRARLRAASAKSDSAPPIEFLQGDALAVPLPDSCADVATISFGIRNVDDPSACLREMQRLLRPGGRAMILEFGRPTFPGFVQIYRLYCAYLMPLIGGLLTGNKAAYQYLPRTSREFPAGSDFAELMRQAGFAAVQVKPLLSGVAYIYIGQAAERGLKEQPGSPLQVRG